MSVHGINGKSGSTIHPLTDIQNRSTEGTTNSALPEGTPLPPIQGGGLIHAASAEIPGDTPGSTVTPNKFGNPMEDYENITQQIKDAEAALKFMEEDLEGYKADVEKYTDELGKAIEELAEANATLEELEETKDDLEKAIKALEEKTNLTEKDKKALEKGKGLLKNINDKIGTATTAGTAMAAVEEAKAKVKAIDETDLPLAEENKKNKAKQIEDQKELIKQLETKQKDSEDSSATGDLDGDGVENHLDPDIDGDGLSNAIEGLLGLNPFSVDSDNDGVKDSGEIILSLKATDNDDLTKKLKALMDKAGKGEDPFAGLDFNPLKADSNGDGIIDKLQVPEKFPKQWASFIYTSGAASGTAGTSEGASAEASAVNWAPPSEAGSKKILTYNNQNADGTPKFPEYGKNGVFEIPFSTEDKILTLSPFDDEVLLEKTGNDLVITIKSTKDGVTKENKLTYKDYFGEDGKATFKLYVFDIADANGKQGIETLEFKGFDPSKIDTFNGYGTHTGGLYLSTGEEATKGAGWEKFKSATKIENTKKPQNPFDNKALKLEAKDDNGVPTITLKKTDIYSGQVGDVKTTTFNFPSEYEGKKLDKWKVTTKVDDAGNENLILDAIDKDGKVIVRYVLKSMAKAAIGKDISKDNSYALNFQMANGGQFVDFMDVNGYVTVDGGDGDDVIKLKAGKVNANAGDDLVIAGDGIDNAQAPSGLNQSPTGKLGVEVHGGDGDDWIFGGSAYDQIYGDKGWDYLDSGGGMAKLDDKGVSVELDQLFGGDGNDVLIVHDPKGLYKVDGGAETDGTNAINFANQNYQETLEKGVWDLNGYMSYLQDKWAGESGPTLAEIKKAYDEGNLTKELLSAKFKELAQNIATVKKAEKEAKFDGTANEKKDEKKT